MQNDIYYQKYLKYKAKYMELKKQEGGVTLKNGDYVFFCSKDEADKICKATSEGSAGTSSGKAPSLNEINKILHKIAYRGAEGETKIEKVRTSVNQASKMLSSVKKNIAASSITASAMKGIAKAADFTNSKIKGAQIKSNTEKAHAAIEAAQANKQAALDKKASNDVAISELATGSNPDVIRLDSAIRTRDMNSLLNVGKQLKEQLNGELNSLVVVTVNSLKNNQCRERIDF